ncbi:putative multidrug resistance ABC transporter ATP-binding/permease protein YheI [bacterium HR37]|nr:putative multidrug resistance ABC transporter ATP-binding/permease protein YheI [bacterium HR37]
MGKKSLFSLLLGHKYSILAGLITLSIVDFAQLSIPLIIERAVDSLTLKGGGLGALTKYALYILGLAIVMSVFRFFWRYFILGASRKIEFDLRNEFFSHLQSLPLEFFYSRKTGDLMAHTVNDIEAIRMACGIGVVVAYDGVLLLVFILAAISHISPKLTLYAVVPFSVLAAVVFVFGRVIEERFEKVQSSFSGLTEKAREVVAGIKLIKAFVKEREEFKEFEGASRRYLNSNLHLIKVWGVYQPLITLIAGLSIGIFLWIGGRSTITGHITLGEFTAISVYLSMLTWPMVAMGWAVDVIRRGRASIRRINEILSVEAEVRDSGGSTELDIRGSVEFKNLRFSYPDGKEALTDITLSIPEGSTLGITGETASGKSTLVKLLLRILEPCENQIFLDGIDVKKLSRETLRRSVVLVPQETFIFSGTVKDNISFMNPNVSDEEIIETAKLACIYDEILAFPEGFETRIGERGLSLSGGQRQRIAIARALLLKPRVLVIDDVFSSLDSHTESKVLSNLLRVMRGKTLIVVSSRVTSLRYFDRIAVLKDGRLVESGTHCDLIKKGGLYARLCRVQMLHDEMNSVETYKNVKG